MTITDIKEQMKMTHDDLLEKIKYSTRGDLLDALEVEKDAEIKSLIINELLSR